MSEPSVTLRVYCHGLGDCLLLRLARDNDVPFWMLIDCGIHSSAKGGKALIREVVADIYGQTTHLDVVVGTHEHWDHISGFTQAADLFQRFTIGEVWLAWTENPADPQARALDKFKGDALAALSGAALGLGALDRHQQTASGLESVLGFVFGAAGELSRAARENLRALSPTVRYLEPATIAPVPEAPGYRVHVLGPPRDARLLGLMDSRSETYAMTPETTYRIDSLANGMAINAGRLSPSADPLAPFDSEVGNKLSELLESPRRPTHPDTAFLSRHYGGPGETLPGIDPDFAPGADQAWRRIDGEWLGAASDLALQLDSRTNNTSLVLAIEIVKTGKVLLFAADAQVGNWKSWAGLTFPGPDGKPPEKPEDATTGAKLLARTVFYKVGHHGSRNATLGPGGLELMTDADLVAFIPTDETMAKAVKWSDIPAEKLLGRIGEKTRGRIIQSDHDWIQLRATKPSGPAAGWFDKVRVGPPEVERAGGLYVEFGLD